MKASAGYNKYFYHRQQLNEASSPEHCWYVIRRSVVWVSIFQLLCIGDDRLLTHRLRLFCLQTHTLCDCLCACWQHADISCCRPFCGRPCLQIGSQHTCICLTLLLVCHVTNHGQPNCLWSKICFTKANATWDCNVAACLARPRASCFHFKALMMKTLYIRARVCSHSSHSEVADLRFSLIRDGGMQHGSQHCRTVWPILLLNHLHACCMSAPHAAIEVAGSAG